MSAETPCLHAETGVCLTAIILTDAVLKQSQQGVQGTLLPCFLVDVVLMTCLWNLSGICANTAEAWDQGR